MTPTIAITVERSEGASITAITIVGPLLTATRDRFRQAVLEELAETRAQLALDAATPRYRLIFTHCPDIDSAGIGCLVKLSKTIREAGGVVHLAGLSEDMRALLVAMKLDQVITIEDAS